MKMKFGAGLILAALSVTGCSSVSNMLPTTGTLPRAQAPVNPLAAEFKDNIKAPADAARVYVLPTFSQGLYSTLDGRAGISVFRDGFESSGAILGHTTAGSFVAFDIAPGAYEFYGNGGGAATVAKASFTLKAGQIYFLRPVFYRSAKDVSAEQVTGGLDPSGQTFDIVQPDVARAEIAKLDMAPISPGGEAFLKATLAAARPAAQPATAQASAPAPATPAQPTVTQDQGIEKRMELLRDMYKKGLITKGEYDAKHKALLDAF